MLVSIFIYIVFCFIHISSACGREEHRCLEKYSRIFVHEGRSLETAGMSASHLLFCSETLVVEEERRVPDPDNPGETITIPSFSWWEGGLGCQITNPNKVGHVLKLLGGRGQHGADNFTKGLKMMECSVISRFCHSPLSSYLYGSGDVEIRNIRFVFGFVLEPFLFHKYLFSALLESVSSPCSLNIVDPSVVPDLMLMVTCLSWSG